jgi:hypothetical protein
VNTGDDMQATGGGAMEFLDFAVAGGLLNSNTAGGLRAAIKEVLKAVDGDGWEQSDLTKIDLDDYGTRFERLTTGKYKPDSVVVYKSRFKNGVNMLLAYLDNPSGWRYKPARPARERGKQTTPKVLVTGRAQDTPTRVAELPGTVTYPFPVRRDVIATLVLPVDLTKAEAKRLAAFVDSIAIETPLLLAAPGVAS